MRIVPLLFTLPALLLLSPLCAQTPTASAGKRPPMASVYWTSRAAGVTYRWTDQDLTASLGSTGKPTVSVARALRQEFGRPEADSGLTYYEVTFRPVSAVGSLLSYERDDVWDGGAHPSGGEAYVTIDVHAPGRSLQLTDLFESEPIRRALLADPIVQHILTREKIAAPPTLAGLVKALTHKTFGGESESMYQFTDGFLSDFAFHHLEKEKVAVRILLPHGSEINRFHHTQLGLILPIPPLRKAAFLQAATGKAGALMPFLQQTARNHKSLIVLLDHGAPPH